MLESRTWAPATRCAGWPPEPRLGGDSLAARKGGSELVSRVEAELAEHAREMTLDRARGDEQHLGDLAIREVLAGQLGDTALACRQRVEPGEHDAPRSRAGRAQLGLGPCGERCGARAMCDVECLPEELAGFGAPVSP